MYVGTINAQLVCETFVDQMGIEILRKNLYHNFILHLCHLFDLGDITIGTHEQTIVRLQRLVESDKESQEVIQIAREQYDIYWETNRATKNQQQILQKTVDDSPADDINDTTILSLNEIIEDKSDKNDTGAGACGENPTLIVGSSSTRHNSTADQTSKRETRRSKHFLFST